MVGAASQSAYGFSATAGQGGTGGGPSQVPNSMRVGPSSGGLSGSNRGYLQGSGGIKNDLNQRMADLDMDSSPGIVGSASTA